MTNKELQDILKEFPDDLEIIIECYKTKDQFVIKDIIRYLSEKDKLFFSV